MSSWDRMGERPIRLEEDEYGGRNGFRSYGETHYSEEYDQNQRGNSGYEEQRPWYKEEDTSLKDMLKDYIRTRTTFDDWFDDSFKVINNRIEQEEWNHQAWIQDLDRRLDIMVADFENQLPVDLPSYAQPNPRTGKTNQSNPTHENNIRGNQGGRDEQVNAIYTRSGFRYGDEEERNGNKTEKIAELGTTAPQSYPLRRSGSPNEHFPVFANQYSSPQYGPMSCSEPVSDSDEEEEEEIEIEKLPENETMVKNEELDEKAEVSSNKDDTVESEDDEIGTLAGALENIVKQSQLEIIELHHTVNRLREESILLKEHAEAQAKELLQRKDQVEELKEKERVSNENVEGLTLGIVAAEEEITRWKVAAQQEAEARKAMEQEYVSQLSQLADTRGARLRKELDEEQKEKNLDVELEEFLGMSIEEASNRDCNDYGNLTLEEIERIFDLSTEPSATKKKNPRLSNNQIDQGLRCQTPSNNAKNANAKDTRSGLNHGNGEEQNGEENEMGADGAPIAPQLTYGLRGNTISAACFLSVAQSVASQLIPLRSNSPEQPGNDPKAHLEVGNHVGYEPMVYNEDETPNSTPIPPTKAYERRKEDSLDMELQELLGMEMGKVDDTIVVDITLDEFERMFDISEDPDLVNEIVVEVEKELEPEMEIERESVIELDGEPCLPLKVDMNPISESKGTSKKLVELIFILTCLEKKEVLQVTNVENDELLDFDYLLHGKPSMKGVEKDKYGGKVGKYNRGDGAIMRETKEWHNAMAKTRMMLIVSTYGIPCDDVIFGFVGERDVFGKWHGEGDWGRPLSHVSLLVEGRKSRAIDSCQKQALYGRQPGFANFIFFYFLLFVFIFSFIETH